VRLVANCTVGAAALLLLSGCFDIDGVTVEGMQSLPVEEVTKIPAVADYLSKHKVYVSLTSSPTRLEKLPDVLETLDLDIVDTVFLALPEKYRNTEPYDIPTWLLQYPKLRILRPSKDIGPATKILPAALEVQADSDAIVISIDDDVAYPRGMVKQIVKLVILEDAVVGGQGRNIEFFGLHRQHWPQIWPRLPMCGESDLSQCDIIEGVGGVGYKAGFLDAARLTQFLGSSKECLKSDDLFIHFHLAEKGVKRLQIKNRFMPYIKPLPIGFGPDALHKEGGTSFANVEKYQKCVRALQDFRI